MTDIVEKIMAMTGIAKIVSARKRMPAILNHAKNTTIAIMGGTVRMDVASWKTKTATLNPAKNTTIAIMGGTVRMDVASRKIIMGKVAEDWGGGGGMKYQLQIGKKHIF